MFRQSKAFSGFSLDNIQKAKEFYGEILGLDVQNNQMGVIELHIEDNNKIIIYPKPDHQPATYTVLNFPVDDIDETIDKLISLGVKFEQYTGDIQTDDKGINRGGREKDLALHGLTIRREIFYQFCKLSKNNFLIAKIKLS